MRLPQHQLRKIVWLLLAIAASLIIMPAFAQDTPAFRPDSMAYHIDIPQRIDTLAVVTESLVESNGSVFEEAIDNLGFVKAVWTVIKMINWYLIMSVIVLYYIVSVRIPFIPTNAFWKRNLAIGILTVICGFVGYQYLKVPLLDAIVSAIAVNFAYEFFFKLLFRALEKIGWLPLPAWYVQEVTAEKHRDIEHVQNAQVVTPPPAPKNDL